MSGTHTDYAARHEAHMDPSGQVDYIPGVGYTRGWGATVGNGVEGWAPSAIFQDTDASAGAQLYVNTGTSTTATWTLMTANAASSYNDGVTITFGTGLDFTFSVVDAGTAYMYILPKTTNTGELRFGNGTLDMDMRWYADTTARFVFWDETAALVTYEQVDLHLGDTDFLEFGDAVGGDFAINFDGSNLEILPKVDDTGAFHIGDGTFDCDFKVFMGATGTHVNFNNASQNVDFTGVNLILDDNSFLAVGDGVDLKLSSDGTNGTIDGAGIIKVGPAAAGSVQLGASGTGTFIKSRLIGFQGAMPVFTNTGTLADSDMLAGIVRGQPTAAASWTLRNGTQFEAALVAIVGAIEDNDTFDMVIVNEAGTTTWDITLIDAAVAGMTIIGNPVVGALADVATEQESQGTFRFRRTAANTFDVIRVA